MRSRIRHIIPAIAVLAVLCALLAAPCRADNWRDGTVTLSTGKTIEGKVYLVGDHIILYNQRQKRRYRIPARDIHMLETVVEKELMARKWFFKEDGRDVKVYTDEKYPVRYYKTRVTFHNGGTMEGHMVGKTLYVKGEDAQTRLQIRRKDEGRVDEKLEDLVYVKRVSFGGGGSSVVGSISGRLQVPEKEKFKKILAINTGENLILEGKTQEDGRTFRFTDCTAGTYDLVAVTDRAVYASFSREKAEKCARLDEKKVADIQSWVDKLRDFFQEQDIVYAAGNEERTLALVRKERHGGTTLSGAALIRRYDVWILHKPRDQWQIETRLFIAREVTEDKDDPREDIVVVPALSGHEVNAEHAELELDLKLERTDEVPVPEPRKEPEGKYEGMETERIEVPDDVR